MNFIDLLVILYLLLGALDGYRRGFFSGLVNLGGFLAGFWAALLGYHFLALFLTQSIFPGLSLALGEIISFVLLFLSLSFLISFLGHFLLKKFEPSSLYRFDALLGIFWGFLTSLVMVGAFLLFLSLLPQHFNLGHLLEDSFIAPKILRNVSSFYQKIEEKIFPQLPQLVRYPEQIFSAGEYQKITQRIDLSQWQALEGATCFNCGGQVKFEGIKKHVVGGEEVYSPYFVCQKCGRHSDSCQTFEGYHQLYGQCPAVLARQGYRFDCGMWPNGNFVKPQGRCPVDGQEAESHLDLLVGPLNLPLKVSL